MNSTRIRFTSGPLTLEGVLTLSSGPGSGKLPAVVIAHPHPLYGGDMNNGVVIALTEKLAELAVPSLRFNFRGVGHSEGSHDNGRGELQDLYAALSFLSTSDGIDPDNIGLAGYSFGAEIVIRLAAQSPHPIPFAAVSPVVSSIAAKRWRSAPGPKLVICGDSDAFLPVERLKASIPQEECHIVVGEDHFWLRKLGEMAQVAGDFFIQYLSRGPSIPTFHPSLC